jgi:uncharacterized protein HemX
METSNTPKDPEIHTSVTPAIAQMIKEDIQADPQIRHSNRLLVLILLAICCAVGLGIYGTIRRVKDTQRLQEENIALKAQLGECQKDNLTLGIEKEREHQLAQIASTQEAEGSVLTRLGRTEMAFDKRRDAIDYIKAMTRRYLLMNANFQQSAKTPPQIVQELCGIYGEKGYLCY